MRSPITAAPGPRLIDRMWGIDPASDRLLDALTSDPVQQLAWTKHGFRGPLGALAGEASGPIAGLLPTEIDAVLPLPAADVMLQLLQRLQDA